MITEAQKKRFRRYCGQLNKLINEIRANIPEANYYLQEDTMCLMVAPSHDDADGGKARYDRVAESVYMPYADGGAW